MKSIEVRTVGSRDSATALLRKLGIKKEDYNKFIQKNGDKFDVLVAAAEASLKAPAAKPEPSSAKKSSAKPEPSAAKKSSAKPEPRDKKAAAKPAARSRTTKPVTKHYDPYKRPITVRTVRSAIIEGILAGSSNEDIWAGVSKEFGKQPDNHRHYPAWYRGQLRRNKIISY